MSSSKSRTIIGKAKLNLPDDKIANILKPSREELLRRKYPEFNMPAPNANGTYNCPYCGNNLSARNALVKHLQTNKKCKAFRSKEGIEMLIDKDFPCEYCGKCMSTKQTWLFHVAGCSGNKIERMHIKEGQDDMRDPDDEKTPEVVVDVKELSSESSSADVSVERAVLLKPSEPVLESCPSYDGLYELD